MPFQMSLPANFDLRHTTVEANGERCFLEALLEAYPDYFDTMAAIDFVSELLRTGVASIGSGRGSIIVRLIKWGG
jgi:hypothetical protein